MTTLRETRERLGLHQADLGRQEVISRIETGKRMPSIALRRLIAERLSAAARAANLPPITLPDVEDLCRAHQPKPKPRRRRRPVRA